MDPTLAEHNQHYAPGDVDADISAALAALSKDHTPLTVDDLAGIDQLHTGGIEATRSLAKRAAITASDRVLDIGGGLGGSARLLAREIGCQVTVIDLTEAFCRAGEKITSQVNLTDHVRFQHGNALDLPFDSGSFDVVWTQHSSMNVPDKVTQYAQIQRVLKPGGRLALHEVIAGSLEPIYLPVGWAHSAAMSFLVTSQTLRDTITRAGFRELAWADKSDWSMTWFQERQQAQQRASAAPNAAGISLLRGPDSGAIMRNMARNLQEGRTRIVEGVFERI